MTVENMALHVCTEIGAIGTDAEEDTLTLLVRIFRRFVFIRNRLFIVTS